MTSVCVWRCSVDGDVGRVLAAVLTQGVVVDEHPPRVDRSVFALPTGVRVYRSQRARSRRAIAAFPATQLYVGLRENHREAWIEINNAVELGMLLFFGLVIGSVYAWNFRRVGDSWVGWALVLFSAVFLVIVPVGVGIRHAVRSWQEVRQLKAIVKEALEIDS